MKQFNLEDEKKVKFDIMLSPGMTLVKRVFYGTAVQISNSKKENINRSSLDKMNYCGIEIVDSTDVNMKKGQLVMLQQHAEVSMIPTKFEDDLFELASFASLLVKSGTDMFANYVACIYALVPNIAIAAVADTDLTLEERAKMFIV